MKHAVFLYVSDQADRALMYARFGHLVLPEFARTRPGALLFPPDTPELIDAVCFAAEREIDLTVTRELICTPREAREASWFAVSLRSINGQEERRLTEYGTTYLRPCLHCFWGAETMGDVRVRAPLMRGCTMGRLEDDVCVSTPIRDAILAAGLTGVRFTRRVLDYRDRPMAEYWVMDFDRLLPPLPPEVWVAEYARASCPHHPARILRSDLQYPAEALAGLDFALGRERLNFTEERPLIVSARARALMREMKVHGRYAPILPL